MVARSNLFQIAATAAAARDGSGNSCRHLPPVGLAAAQFPTTSTTYQVKQTIYHLEIRKACGAPVPATRATRSSITTAAAVARKL